MRYATEFHLPHDATGDARIWGRFEECYLFGQHVAIETKKLDNGDPRAVDILGVAGAFRRGEPCIHISGLHDDGSKILASPHVAEIGIYRVDWLGKKRGCAGTGCSDPEAVISERYRSRAFWDLHSCDSYVTLRGIVVTAARYGYNFDARTICALIQKSRPESLTDYSGPRHVRAVRRLLDDAVARETKLITESGITFAIRKSGRHGFRITEAAK